MLILSDRADSCRVHVVMHQSRRCLRQEFFRRQPNLPLQMVAEAAGSVVTAGCRGGMAVCSGETAGCSRGTVKSPGLREGPVPARAALHRRCSGMLRNVGCWDARGWMLWRVLLWPGCLAWACPAALAAAVPVSGAAAGWLHGHCPGYLHPCTTHQLERLHVPLTRGQDSDAVT